jgi:ferric-dicitrate binding protein FerR (iron transport regulator)
MAEYFQQTWTVKTRSDLTLLRKNNFRILVAAASIACLMAIGGVGLWIVSKNSFHQMISGSTIVATKEGEKARIILSDSSVVILNSDSRVQYVGNYNLTDRRVNLSGEAFFDISTNPEVPFIVQLENMSISATGTRFNVFSFKNENRVETTLEEGSIQVSVKGKEPIM